MTFTCWYFFTPLDIIRVYTVNGSVNQKKWQGRVYLQGYVALHPGLRKEGVAGSRSTQTRRHERACLRYNV